MSGRTARWALLAPVVGAALVAAGVLGSLLGAALGVWDTPWIGALCAATVVSVSCAVAPARRRLVASVALLMGAALAWRLLRPPSFYPESYGELAYQPTYVPILATYAAGLAAWLVCVLRAGRVDDAAAATARG